jgi:hypothetical protein
MNEKLILANRNLKEQGKTTAILEVYRQLSKNYPNKVTVISMKDSRDINATIEIRGVLVGIESQGDPGSRMTKSVDKFVEKGCKIIVVACRTRGATCSHIIKVSKEYNYDLIFATHDVIYSQLELYTKN